MDWLIPFSPAANLPDDSARPLPAPSDAESRDARVKVLALRWQRGERLWQPGDWIGSMDPALVHESLGRAGDDRRANGTDKPAELVCRDPFDEFADDHQGLPDGWLEEELAAFRQRAQAPTRRAA